MAAFDGARLVSWIRWQWNRLHVAVMLLAAVLALMMALSATAGPQAGLPAQQTAPPTAVPQMPGASPMDEPLRLLAGAGQTYQNIRDYQCLFIKQERLRGRLQPDNIVEMKVRTQPFSVYMRWIGPSANAGQEACYISGRNNGMMRVHTTGLAGMVGFVSLDPHDPRAMQNSRHAITEAGIGNLIEKYSARWQGERQLNRTQVQVADYLYNNRPCTRVEMVHPDRTAGQYYAYRSVVYFDKEYHLPIRVENYDWPVQGGAPGGDLLECYSYANLRLNVGLSDIVFAH